VKRHRAATDVRVGRRIIMRKVDNEVRPVLALGGAGARSERASRCNATDAHAEHVGAAMGRSMRELAMIREER
jgi:hypothetical protein